MRAKTENLFDGYLWPNTKAKLPNLHYLFPKTHFTFTIDVTHLHVVFDHESLNGPSRHSTYTPIHFTRCRVRESRIVLILWAYTF